MQLPHFKIRSSAIGQIMTECPVNITDKQLETIKELEAKEKLTDKQSAELARLREKRDAPPQLSKGAKTYCQNWVKEQLYQRRREFSNKYTEKGDLCEPASIEMIAERFGYGMVEKNTMQFEDEYSTGEPDLITVDWVDDAKNSWHCWTFPLFEEELPDKDYFFQIQRYMHLTGKKKGRINYCLINAPEELIDREARSVAYKAGMAEVEIELFDEIYAKMTYDGLPIDLRHKYYEFEYSPELNRLIDDRVIMCRQYISSLTQPHIITAHYDAEAMVIIVE